MKATHIKCNKEDIANIVLMPGDPLRAKYIAKKYLNNYKLINTVRNMLGYTGYYKNQRITVIASGMGMASIGLYAFELFNIYDVQKIIRIGTCGTQNKKIKVGDIIIANEATTSSNIAYLWNKTTKNTFPATSDLVSRLKITADYNNINYYEGTTMSSDFFGAWAPHNILYNNIDKNKIVAEEMEAFMLFFLAYEFQKEAACVLTVSDGKNQIALTPEEREKSLDKMILLSLNSIT